MSKESKDQDCKEKLGGLIEKVINEGASDLHLSTGYHPMIRVAGTLLPLLKEPEVSRETMMGFLAELLGKQNREMFLEKQEFDFSYAYKDGKARFRGNAFFHRHKPGVALRLISGEIRTLSELNLPSELEEFTRLRQGFFLVVGPVGHGKTTTVASMVNLINQERAEHIVAIEDPIEYVFKSQKSLVHQREVRVDTDSFADALRSVFREDMDVLFVGEMRGRKTMEAAVTAGETGHLVFSTLHTNNAAQTVDRIIDSFPPDQQDQVRSQLSSSLAGIFSQRLIPRISGGRIPAYELLRNNNAVANLIRENRTHEIDTVIETSAESGMISMDRSLAELVRKGEISAENAKAYSLNPENLRRIM